MQEKGKGLKGILQNSFSLTLVLVVQWSGFSEEAGISLEIICFFPIFFLTKKSNLS